ncbi:MAG: TonB-dependent receptor plug domain-containing protein, partial [Elusimicrobiota bacterium]
MSNLIKTPFFLSFLLVLPFVLCANELNPSQITIISKEELERGPSYSVADVLAHIGFVNIERHGSVGTPSFLKLRGGTPGETLILIDGRPIHYAGAEAINLSEIPLSFIDHIEIMRGGASFRYSSEAYNGAINLVTLRPEEKNLNVMLKTGVGRDGVVSNRGEFFYRTRIGDFTYAPGLLKSGGFQGNEEVGQTDHFFNFSRSFNGKGYWGVEYFYHEASFGTPKGTQFPFNKWDTHLEIDPNDRTSLKENNNQYIKLELGSIPVKKGNLNISFVRSLSETQSKSSRKSSPVNEEDLNFDYVDVSYVSHFLEFGMDSKQTTQKIFSQSPHGFTKNSFFVLLPFKAGKLSLRPQVRWDDYSYSNNAGAYRITGLYSLSSQWLFSSSWQKGNKSPFFSQVYDLGKKFSLSLEEISSFDSGIRFNNAHNLDASYTFFIS